MIDPNLLRLPYTKQKRNNFIMYAFAVVMLCAATLLVILAGCVIYSVIPLLWELSNGIGK